MVVLSDPENNETRALFGLADFTGKNILEIGCGDGRLTWLYADVTAHVTAIDSFEEGVRQAKEKMPDNLRDRVDFRQATFEEFSAARGSADFDIVLFSWSL